MDRGRQMSPWKNNFAPCLFIFMLVILQPWPLLAQDPTCAEDEHEHSDQPFCCNKCPPGFRKVEDCSSPNHRTKCEKCKSGTWQNATNYYERCYTCYKCKDTEVQVRDCDHINNRVCECKEGFFKRKPYPTSDSHECHRCKVCQDGEREESRCTPDHDTVCRPRESCLKECSQSCGSPSNVTLEQAAPQLLIAIPSAIGFVTLVIAVVAGVLVHCKKQRWKHEKAPLPKQKADELPSEVTSTEALIISMDSSSSEDNESVPSPTYARMEKLNSLPHCVKKEINTNEFIYALLDEVPVQRVMELVRRLGVKDQSIDRARRDNPMSCHEAQYQMLKVWSDSGPRGGGGGGGGGGGTLSWPLLQTLLSTLADMGLRGCAEALEEKYELEHLEPQ